MRTAEAAEAADGAGSCGRQLSSTSYSQPGHRKKSVAVGR